MGEKICISDLTLDALTAYTVDWVSQNSAPSRFLNGCTRSL